MWYEKYADTEAKSIGRALFYLEQYGVPLRYLEILQFGVDTVELYGRLFAYVHWFNRPEFIFVKNIDCPELLVEEWEHNQKEKGQDVLKYEEVLTAIKQVNEAQQTLVHLFEDKSLVFLNETEKWKLQFAAKKRFNIRT